jgi:hypothetical protein
MFKCKYCNYISERKFNLTRHISSKHCEEFEKIENLTNQEKVNPNQEKVNPNQEKVNPFQEKVNLCKTCNKIYKTKQYLRIHELKCKKVDSLTCSKCMISFTTKQAKSRHIKADKCKARSIIHARIPYSENITIHTENQNITNNIDNSVNKTINNIIINNLGSERIDHITKDEITRILTSGINTLPLYIKKKHFDKDFPENNNIIYTNENKCKVMEDNQWTERDLGLLSNTLIKDNTEVLLLYYDDNKLEIGKAISNVDILENVKDKLIFIYNKQDGDKYNQILSKIKDLIKNFKNDV